MKRGRKPKSFYVFDFTGEFIFSGTKREIGEKCKIKDFDSISTSILRKSLVNGKYYIFNEKRFVMPIKKINVNPLKYNEKQKLYGSLGTHLKDENFDSFIDECV